MPSAAVVCFPPAGAGASFYQQWQDRSDQQRVIPVDLPGREKKFVVPVPDDVETLVAGLAPELVDAIADAQRVAVFGHSFGAVLAYEMVRALRDAAPGLNLMLVASGSPGPGTLRAARIADRDDSAFLAAVRAISGYHHPALDDPELRELLLPVLRSDVRLHENYAPAQRPPLDVPVAALRGRADDIVTRAQADKWQDVTAAGFRSVDLPGGHMYLVDAWPEVLHTIEELSDTLVAGR